MTFAYHRSLAPMMWVLLALMLIETAVAHLLIALLNPGVALILSLVSAAAILWVVLLIRSFRARPVRIADGRLHWPAGRLRAIEVDLAQVAGLRGDWNAELLKARSCFNAALIAYPNIVIELTGPVAMGRRRIERIAHKLDDREAFVAALVRLDARHDP